MDETFKVIKVKENCLELEKLVSTHTQEKAAGHGFQEYMALDREAQILLNMKIIK